MQNTGVKIAAKFFYQVIVVRMKNSRFCAVGNFFSRQQHFRSDVGVFAHYQMGPKTAYREQIRTTVSRKRIRQEYGLDSHCCPVVERSDPTCSGIVKQPRMSFNVPRSGSRQLPSESHADCRIVETPDESLERVWVCWYRVLGQKNNQICVRKHVDTELASSPMIELVTFYGMDDCFGCSERLHRAII